MGAVFDRGTKGTLNIWIRVRDLDGKLVNKRVGGVILCDLTKEDAAQEEQDLRRRARLMVAQAEDNVARGLPAFPEDVKAAQSDLPLFEDDAPAWMEKRTQRPDLRNTRNESGIMRNYLVKAFAGMRLDQITPADVVEKLIEAQQGKLSGATIRLHLMLLSRYFNELRIRKPPIMLPNPVHMLDKQTRSRAKSTHDPDQTPHLETKDDIRTVYLTLPEHIRPMFAVGVFAGLRNSEILALQLGDVDLVRRELHVRRQKVHGGSRKRGVPVPETATARTKGKRSRVLPITDTLLPILREAKLAAGAGPWLFPSRLGGMRHIRTMEEALTAALAELHAKGRSDIPQLTWYQATRHTYATHFMRDGGDIRTLQRRMGHTSVLVTDRYAHDRDEFTAKDFASGHVDLSPAKVVKLKKGGRR